jgi:DNA adenine methylase
VLLRYAGGKQGLAGRILRAVDPEWLEPLWLGEMTYCEPFFGSGAVGWGVIKHLRGVGRLRRVLINDIDPGVAALWESVRLEPEALGALVEAFRPTVGAFAEFKRLDGAPGVPRLVAGFRKLALHRMSFSGLGAVAGGCIGGRKQGGAYEVGARWNPRRIVADIRDTHALMAATSRAFEVSCGDFEDPLSALGPNDLAYLDPPYYADGPALYKYHFRDADHLRLARCLRACRCRWVLSYDDHPFVRQAYSWARLSRLSTPSYIGRSRGKRRVGTELLFLRPS